VEKRSVEDTKAVIYFAVSHIHSFPSLTGYAGSAMYGMDPTANHRVRQGPVPRCIAPYTRSRIRGLSAVASHHCHRPRYGRCEHGSCSPQRFRCLLSLEKIYTSATSSVAADVRHINLGRGCGGRNLKIRGTRCTGARLVPANYLSSLALAAAERGVEE